MKTEQVKIFIGRQNQLESVINKWIVETNASIKHIHIYSNVTDSRFDNMTVIIVYTQNTKEEQ